MVGNRGGPDCKKLLSPGRPLGPQDCMRGRPAFEVPACTVRRYSSSVCIKPPRSRRIGLSHGAQNVSHFE